VSRRILLGTSTEGLVASARGSVLAGPSRRARSITLLLDLGSGVGSGDELWPVFLIPSVYRGLEVLDLRSRGLEANHLD